MSRLLGPLTLRCDSRGTWWALSHRSKGFASFGYPFPFLGDALDSFNAKLTGFGTDEHGLYLAAAEKLPRFGIEAQS